MKTTKLLGAHLSISGGLDKAIDKAKQLESNCLQIFTKSNRQWQAKSISETEQTLFKKKLKDSAIKFIVAHAAYLINLGSKNEKVRKNSIESLIQELQRCDQLAIPYLVFHPGTSYFESEEESLQFLAQQIDLVIKKSQTTNVTLLLEIMAGQGKSIGYNFQQLGKILSYSKEEKRLGICFDTCHAFAAGYHFDTKESATKMWQDFDKEIGIQKLKLFHLNDSKNNLGSKIDRHENIGMGKIPLNAFKLILQNKNFQNIPKIIETPKSENDLESDKKNLDLLKSLA
ncbi:deoxyribonuclease IV [Candidatus Dependentiae bacterium]|nr:deoxyribonuclease IV [Candidatus Dependentiae bacterium]